jgi:hypothetical protein
MLLPCELEKQAVDREWEPIEGNGLDVATGTDGIGL